MARCLTIAVCQTGPIQRSASRAETVGRLVHLLEEAAAAGAELAVFPEMALTTFFPRWRIDDTAEIEAFFAVAVGIKARGKGATSKLHLPEKPVDRFFDSEMKQFFAGFGVCPYRQANELSIVVEHFFEMRHEPRRVR